jgi:hypothetical protein
MRCFYVLVHGRFDYHVDPVPTGLDIEGFYASRCLFAHNADEAVQKAFAKVKNGLDDWNTDIRDGLISIRFAADEVEPCAWWHAFRRFNRGHVFYAET